MYKLGVIGDPIAHSQSPIIHRAFAAQFAEPIDYQKYRVSCAELKPFIADFFANGGHGLNVTLPHKKAVIPLLDQLTPEAESSQSVNTIIKTKNNQLLGDTTDGAGLLMHLAELNFNFASHRIILLGAGGASQSILLALLKAGAQVEIINRTEDKVTSLVGQFKPFGEVSHFSASGSYAGCISAISEFNPKLFSQVAPFLGRQMFCYDLNYGHRANKFCEATKEQGVVRFSDGYGMLLGQAAQAFQRWTGHLPQIDQVNIEG